MLSLILHEEEDSAMNNPESVIACLKRSLKIANNAQQNASQSRGSQKSINYISLFIEALNYYLYFFLKVRKAQVVTPRIVITNRSRDSYVHRP